MSVGRNDPCPCGSGRKYKKCCLLKEKLFDPYNAINQIVADNQYPRTMAQTIENLVRFISERKWYGACHASCAALYVALRELGFNPKLCAGEVDAHSFIFDHSWIELDGKIIDAAIAFPLQGNPLSNLIIFGVDIFTKEPSSLIYGTSRGTGLDIEANFATTVPFCVYMDNFPDAPNGLWSVVEYLLGHKVDIAAMRTKYSSTKWTVC